MLRNFLIAVFCISCFAAADRVMDQAEVNQLLQTLTSRTRQSWMPYGMIQARHLQYYDFQNKISDTTETIYFDGQKYWWQVKINPDRSLDMNNQIEDTAEHLDNSEDFLSNKENIYVWNGKKQVRYYKASNYAIVNLGRENASSAIDGPPSAGIIPWGKGDCSLEVLRECAPNAWQIFDAGHSKIKLEYVDNKYNPPAKITILLDSLREYAVLSYTMENHLAMMRNTYDDFKQTAFGWIPSKIMIERFDMRDDQSKLMSYEDWQFEEIDFQKPDASLFAVKFKPGTIVEMQPSQTVKTFMYQASQDGDIEQLLQDKISIHAKQEQNNCATAAVRYIARKFAKHVENDRLAKLVSNEKGKTRLCDLQASLQEMGLECMAITTDIETLGKISNCTKIVHFSASNHYVIVDRIEQDAVWVIDLVNRKFYWKKPLNEFLMEWNKGTTLLVSNEPINIPAEGKISYLNSSELYATEGGDFGGTYSCSDHLQDYQHILCSLPVGFLCGGAYYKFYERLGCKEDANGGTCVGQQMIGYEFSHCINKINDGCTITGEWESRYIRACQ